MAFLIGTDEAGYGPNLGPLVVSASVWKLPDYLLGADLYPLLANVIAASAPCAGTPPRLVIADSKQLYRPGGGLVDLERAVLSFLELTQHRMTAWRDVWLALDPKCTSSLQTIPWYAEYNVAVPLQVDRGDLDRWISVLCEGFADRCVSCLAVRSAVVFTGQLNELIDQYGNKATVLSHVTLMLVKSLLESFGPGPAHVHCDKHGGRNKYGSLLQPLYPDDLVEVRRESRTESIYRCGPAERRVEIRFTAKGEKCLASALASMTSKYLRELAMQAFNHFWCQHVPGLRPTAGYPVDARRFRAEIRSVQQELGVTDQVLWRRR